MITPKDLTSYIETLRAAGVTGRVKIGDIEVTIPAAVVESTDPKKPPRNPKAAYDALLFACTEGLPDEEFES